MQARITFGIIVLNGEPFLRYNLRALYPFAHEIIVVEGACPSASGVATPDGHSRDDTMATLRRFKADEDPENKVILVTAEDAGHTNGFWSEKDEMSQAYADRATGNYVWQIDADEFYMPEGIREVRTLLDRDPSISGMTVRAITFWASLKFTTDSFAFHTGEQRDIHRIFAWKPGYSYSSHRPPTVVDAEGTNLRSLNWISAGTLARRGVYVYHYPLLFPKQVEEKCAYYARLSPAKFGEAERWARESYTHLQHPFHVHHIMSEVSWLGRYTGMHPPQVAEMVEDVGKGHCPRVELRGDEDADELMSAFSYRTQRALLIALIPLVLAVHHGHRLLRPLMRRTPVWRLFQNMKKSLQSSTSYK